MRAILKILMLNGISRKKGFTVVELMVVVAIIIILAMIIVFAFGNWRQRTATTEVKTALTHLSAALKNELNFNSTYPSTVPSSYTPSNTVTITYTSTGTTFCASGKSTAETSVVWYITSTQPVPTQTAC